MDRDRTRRRDDSQPPRDGRSSPGERAPTGPAVGQRAAEGEVPESIRGPATVLIVVYLVGLALCVAGNTASGTSLVVATLKDRFFSPWMVPPWLDLGHDTRLTYGLPEDADHRLEIRPAGDPGTNPAAGLRFPAAGDRSERAARWRRLAKAAALAEEDAVRAGVLPAAIGAGLFARAGEDDLLVRIVRAVPPDYDAPRAAPAGETPLEVRVRRIDGELQMIPLPPAEEVAPLIDAAPANGGKE